MAESGGLVETDIAALCAHDGVPITDSVITCAPSVLERVRFSLLGHRRDPRTGFRIRIASPNFRGNLQIYLGVGGADVAIAGDGPMQLDLRLWRNPKLSIGAGTTMNGVRIIADNADIAIGEDTLWSDDVIVQANDQHGIVQRSTRQLINAHRRRVTVGDHVWIGRRAMIMPDVAIGQGAILGFGAILTSDMPAHTAFAGVPARQVADDITWSRDPDHIAEHELKYF